MTDLTTVELGVISPSTAPRAFRPLEEKRKFPDERFSDPVGIAKLDKVEKIQGELWKERSTVKRHAFAKRCKQINIDTHKTK